MTALGGIRARSIVSAVADAAQRWCDGDFPPRVRALDRIAERTGYSQPVVEYALDRLFFSITPDALQAVIRAELGSLDALDGFSPRPGRPNARASPAGSVCVISSRTTIGVALIPAVFAMCAKCDVLVKDREDALAAAFFETLAQERNEFARAARAAVWDPGESNAPSLERFDAVVAFGHDGTLAAIRSALKPEARFIGYGSRASAGYVTRESLESAASARDVARGAARDLVLYESEGCLSLHVLFAERGATVHPDAFARMLADAVERANVEFPLGSRDAATIARVGQQRAAAAFRAASGTGAVHTDEGAAYAVVFDPPPSEPPQFLPRMLGVIPVDGPQDALAYLRAHRLPLEGFALSSDRVDAVDAAVRSGAVRLARFGELQHPPLGGDHCGRPRIAEFVRWIDITL